MKIKQFSIITSLLVLFMLNQCISQTVNVVRVPYLQSPTSSSIKIKWRTDTTTNSRVYYGIDMANLTDFFDDSTSTTEHTVQITGLSPFTKYYYSIGTTTETLAGPSVNHHFTTSPTPGTVQPIRIWSIGDMGKGNTEQADVREAYLNYTGNTHTDVWLWLGDNAYQDGTDQEFQDKVFDSISGYATIFPYMPFMPCPGNHDYLSVAPPTSTTDPPNHTGPYYDIVDVPTNGEAGGVASGYELYYSYDYGNIHFISLNSELSSALPGGYNWTGANPFSSFSGSPMTDWLESDLQANDKKWVIAYWHQPPYTKGSHDSDDAIEIYMKAMKENFIPIIEQYGVDLVLNGHSHVYERSYLINGHTGNSSSFDFGTMVIDGSSGNLANGEPYMRPTSGTNAGKGTVYVVCGNAASKTSAPSLNYPAMFTAHGCDTCVGSLVIDVHADTLTARYITGWGAVLDEFTILKSDPVSVLENAVIKNVKIYPNPFKNQTNIEFALKENTDIAIEVFDMAGKLVYTVSQGKQQTGDQKFVLDAQEAELKKGIFILKITSGNTVQCETVVKVE